jgi:hypothetical protein
LAPSFWLLAPGLLLGNIMGVLALRSLRQFSALSAF